MREWRGKGRDQLMSHGGIRLIQGSTAPATIHVCKAHRLCVSLNSRLESNKEEEEEPLYTLCVISHRIRLQGSGFGVRGSGDRIYGSGCRVRG